MHTTLLIIGFSVSCALLSFFVNPELFSMKGFIGLCAIAAAACVYLGLQEAKRHAHH